MRSALALLAMAVSGGCSGGLEIPEKPDASPDLSFGGRDLAGCRSDSDCAISALGPRCDVVTGRCQICLPENDNCPKGTMCIDGFGAKQCASGCRDASNCGALGGGATCCSGICVNPASDILNCGGCGMRCPRVANGEPGCASGKCILAACDPGYDDCDHKPDNGCETNLLTDLNSCGGCFAACKLAPYVISVDCRKGACVNTACQPGFGDCDANQKNGCEADLANNLAHCGRCGAACKSANAIGTCAKGLCVLQCKPGFQDCDMDSSNGCEASLQTDAKNCGACGNACAQGRACVMGVCV